MSEPSKSESLSQAEILLIEMLSDKALGEALSQQRDADYDDPVLGDAWPETQSARAHALEAECIRRGLLPGTLNDCLEEDE